MSSRSLAAARSRRAGENAPPVSGNRPGTSIGSYASHGAPPQQQNVRIARPQQQNMYQPQGGPQQNMYQPQGGPQQNMYQQPGLPQQQAIPQQNQNGLPFTKLSISDAIGLITIRLGRVEQWIIETDHENDTNDNSNNGSTIDNSIITNFASRLDSLEKKEPVATNSEDVTKLIEDVGKMNQHLAKIVEESTKHSLITSKHTEQLFRFERELVETKDILKTFMLKYDQFASETTEKFSDFEYAITEIEKNIQSNEENQVEENLEGEESQDDGEENKVENEEIQTSSIMSVDLKNLIKQELSTSIDE